MLLIFHLNQREQATFSILSFNQTNTIGTFLLWNEFFLSYYNIILLILYMTYNNNWTHFRDFIDVVNIRAVVFMATHKRRRHTHRDVGQRSSFSARQQACWDNE